MYPAIQRVLDSGRSVVLSKFNHLILASIPNTIQMPGETIDGALAALNDKLEQLGI